MSEVIASKTLQEKYPTIIKNFLERFKQYSELEKARKEYLNKLSDDPLYFIKTSSGFYEHAKYASIVGAMDKLTVDLNQILSKISNENIPKLITIIKQTGENYNPNFLIQIVARKIENDDYFKPVIEKYQIETEEGDLKKEIFFETLFQDYIQKEEFSKLEEIFLQFHTNQNVRQAALNLVVEPSYNDKTRLQIAISFINCFGFITLIDSISGLAKNASGRPDIKKLYATLNGQEFENLIEVFRNPAEIYSIPDTFKEDYYSDQITNREINLTIGLLSKLNLSPKESKVLDLGAGRGRITFGLLNNGVGKIYSVDIDPTLQEAVTAKKKKDDTENRVEVIRGDWYSLAQNPNIPKVDLGVCVGRSLPHANNMTMLVRALSQMTDVSDNWLIDYPDSSVPLYQSNIQNLQENFQRLGINGRNALMIFDGPNSNYMINRMVASPEQLSKIGKLLGFSVEKIGEYGINFYFKISRIPNWNYLDLNFEEVKDICQDLGLISSEGIDTYLPGWGMTIAQIIGFYFKIKQLKEINKLKGGELDEQVRNLKHIVDLENERYRENNEGRLPKSRFEILEDGSKVIVPWLGDFGLFQTIPAIIRFDE